MLFLDSFIYFNNILMLILNLESDEVNNFTTTYMIKHCACEK